MLAIVLDLNIKRLAELILGKEIKKSWYISSILNLKQIVCKYECNDESDANGMRKFIYK